MTTDSLIPRLRALIKELRQKGRLINGANYRASRVAAAHREDADDLEALLASAEAPSQPCKSCRGLGRTNAGDVENGTDWETCSECKGKGSLAAHEAATPVIYGGTELLKCASQFDDALGRCQLYGNADSVRERWHWLKFAIIAYVKSEPASAESAPVERPDGDPLCSCGHLQRGHAEDGCQNFFCECTEFRAALPPSTEPQEKTSRLDYGNLLGVLERMKMYYIQGDFSGNELVEIRLLPENVNRKPSAKKENQ